MKKKTGKIFGKFRYAAMKDRENKMNKKSRRS